MSKYLALGIACITLMLSGMTRASQIYGNDDGNKDKGKMDFRWCDQSDMTFGMDYHYDMHGDCDLSKLDDKNKDKDKDKDKDKHFKCDWHMDKHQVDFCDMRWDCHDDNDRCDRHDRCGEDHCDRNPCSVPLPASSATGGLGVMGVALVGWLRRRRAAIA